ncbi:MAG: hypothetical protein HQ539_02815 [Parcubacteria group bacterium]|nr:hypothetical protein [Parcubacteria group bacterium]
MSITLSLLMGLGIAYSITKIADNRNSYIIDRRNLRNWAKMYYNKNIEDLPPCSICGKKVNEKHIEKIFTHRGRIYVVCKKRDCHMRNKEEVIESGSLTHIN